MIAAWFAYLKRGLARRLPPDGIAGRAAAEGASTRANLRNLRPFALRHWRPAAVGGVGVLLISLLGLAQPLVTRYLVDDVILKRQLRLLAGAILLLAGIKVVGKLAGLFEQFYFTRLEQTVLLDIQHDLLDRTLRFPLSFFDTKQTGYLMSRLLSDVQGLRWFFSSTLVYVVSGVLQFLGGVALLFYLQPRLAVVPLLLLPLLVWCARYFAGKLRVLGHQGMEQQAQVSRQMQESLSAIPLIKAFASERRAAGRILSALTAAMQLSLEQSAVGSAANLAIASLPDVAHALVWVVGAYWVIRGQWSLGSLLAFQAYLGSVYGPAQFLATANLQLQNALAALERVSALFDIVPEDNLGTGRRVERLTGEIEFKHVSFSYDGQEAVLQDLSCLIRPGEHVAILGPSGVGKTTLLSLLLCFYQPTQGEICFDGRPAAQYELASLRQRIGYVAQSTLLLSGTIDDNLRYGNPEASDAQVTRAAQAAGIHEFITGLPAGYQAHVGERGVNLSEGQKQRLAIARALVKDPDILVLDEPTSALDGATEQSVVDGLPALLQGKTLFWVSHRPSTLRHADRILLLNEKRLLAVGTPAEILQHSAAYATALG